MKKIIKLIENEKAQSEIVGYILTIATCIVLLVSTAFVMSMTVEDQKKNVAKIEAKSLANRIAGVITEAVEVKQDIPNASFKRKIEIPSEIGGYKYYIEATNSKVTVKSDTADLEISCSLFEVVNKPHIKTISGKVHSNYKYLTIFLDYTNSSKEPVSINIEGE